jgi:hypothetical protein
MNVLFINTDDSTSKIKASDLPFIKNHKDIVISTKYYNEIQNMKASDETISLINKYDIIFLTPDHVVMDDIIKISKNMKITAILIFYNGTYTSDERESLTSYIQTGCRLYAIHLESAKICILTKTNYDNLYVSGIPLIQYIYPWQSMKRINYINIDGFINYIIEALYNSTRPYQHTFSPLNNDYYEPQEYNYKNIIARICILIIICAVTVWVIKYVYPYLKRKLTQNQLYIVMGIISMVLFGITAFILWHFIILFIQIRRDKNQFNSSDPIAPHAVPAYEVPIYKKIEFEDIPNNNSSQQSSDDDPSTLRITYPNTSNPLDTNTDDDAL